MMDDIPPLCASSTKHIAPPNEVEQTLSHQILKAKLQLSMCNLAFKIWCNKEKKI